MSANLLTAQAALSAFLWLVVAAGATLAVFSKRIRDTVTERIALAGIAVSSVGTTCRIVQQGWISEGGLMLSACLAFYVCSIVWKHWHRVDIPPGDKQ